MPVVLFAVLGLTVDVGYAWAQAEGVIRGQVVAAADGSALAHSPVTLTSGASGESWHADTDLAGWFSFSPVRPGEYALSASSDGFSARSIDLVLQPREVRLVTVSLEVGGLAVSVTVTGEALLPSTRSPSSTVLTPERVDVLPAAQRTSLPDALVTLAPGMIRGHDDFVHIRGHEVALNPLINGVFFWENPHAQFAGGLSPDVIETANVMTGGFSAEYGNRFGGVADIVTKSGFNLRESGTLTLNAGEAARRSASGELGGSRERFAYYLFGSVFRSDRFLSPPDPRAIHDRARGGHAFVQLDGNLGDAGTLRAVFIGGAANFDIPTTPLDVELRPLARAEQRTRQQTAIVGWSRGWSDMFLSASTYQRWSRVHLLPAEGPLTARASLARELLTVGAKADVTRSAGPHTVKTGIDVVRLRPREDLAYDYAGYRDFTHLVGVPHLHVTGQRIASAGRESGGQVSVYAQDTIQLAPRVTADLGVRVDHYGLVITATHASPRANVALQVGRDTVLHASYNRFFVPPPIEGVLSSGAGLTRSIREIGVALPASEPTVEDQFEFGITTPMRPLQVGVTGYVRASDNPVHTTVWPDSRIYSYASFDRARAYGVELKADAPGLARYGLTGYVNYALGRVYFYNPATGGFVTEADHLIETNRFLGPMDQTHTLTAGATYTHTPTGLRLGTAVEYGSGTPIDHAGADDGHADGDVDHDHTSPAGGAVRVPGHVTANVSLAIDLVRDTNRRPRFSLQLDIENVANRLHLLAQESEFSPTQFSIPRLISGTARVRF
ncbi:MAG: TonB-dependent receptor [Acidobacteria bacterium]|nr:TonB-dependent receptor [Acidobacteriota bacterium]